MKQIVPVAILLSALSLSGCSFFQISDEYGNTYGGFTDFGNQYAWQLSTCEADPGLVHILSPFDPLIIQRKRTELFFDYGHRFEAYLPKEKRLFGYFALPVLVGDDIVAAIDLKTDRKAKKLLMQKWSWVGGAPKGAPRKELKRRIEEELHRFERFQLAD